MKKQKPVLVLQTMNFKIQEFVFLSLLVFLLTLHGQSVSQMEHKQEQLFLLQIALILMNQF